MANTYPDTGGIIMFSLKDTIRKTIIAVSLAAVTTSIFTGCNNNQPVSSNDLYPPTITAEAPPSLTDDIDPTTPDANNFSIKFKYWYDNPDVQEAQAKTPTPGGDDSGETFLDLAGLPIYTDSSGNQYIISGRTPVYLKDGKISEKDMLNLRSESDGKRFYMMYPAEAFDSLTAVKDKIAASEKTQPATYDERVENDTPATKIEGTVAVYMNNTDTNILFSSSSPQIAITNLVYNFCRYGYLKRASA